MSIPPLRSFRDECDSCDALGVYMDSHGIKMPNGNKDKSKPQEKKDESEFWSKQEPPDIIELGNAGWTVLHSLAAYYPDKPSSEDKVNTKQFLHLFAKTFPCKHCGDDFEYIMNIFPPKLKDQKSFAIWMCNAHNHVNKSLGKPDFDCSIENLNQRWCRK